MSEKSPMNLDVEAIYSIRQENEKLIVDLINIRKLMEELRQEIDYFKKKFEDKQEYQRREFESRVNNLSEQIDSLREREDVRSEAHWQWIYSEKDRIFKDRERILQKKAEKLRQEKEEFIKMTKA